MQLGVQLSLLPTGGGACAFMCPLGSVLLSDSEHAALNGVELVLQPGNGHCQFHATAYGTRASNASGPEAGAGAGLDAAYAERRRFVCVGWWWWWWWCFVWMYTCAVHTGMRSLAHWCHTCPPLLAHIHTNICTYTHMQSRRLHRQNAGPNDPVVRDRGTTSGGR